MGNVIVAGSRTITDYSVVEDAIADSGFEPETIISGGTAGVGILAEEYALRNDIPLEVFEADWDTYGKHAGPKANNQMALDGDELVAIWEDGSGGTRNMIEAAMKRRLPVHVHPIGYEGVFENTLTEAELMRRFPELKRIDDIWIRSVTVDALLNGYPDYLWDAPSSGSKRFHPPDERGPHGQWLHVKRMFYAYEEMSASLIQADEISTEEQDLGKAAVFLHDAFKNGIPPTTRTKAAKFHDTLAGEYVRNFTDLPETVARLCDVHNGPWGNHEVPQTPHEWVFHEADMISSRSGTNLAVYEPTDELRGISDQLIDAGTL